MIGRRRIAFSIAWLTSGSGLQAIVAFAANLVLVRVLAPADFGRYALVEASLSLVAAILGIKLSEILIQRPTSESFEDSLDSYLTVVILNAGVIGLAGLVVLWMTGYMNDLSLILLGAFVFSLWVRAQTATYERRFEYGRLATLETTALVFAHALSVAGALAGLGPIVLYSRPAIQFAVLALGLRVVGGLRLHKFVLPTATVWRSIFMQGGSYWFDGVIERLLERGVILSAGLLAGEAGAGYFYQAQRLAVTPHQLLAPVTTRLAFNLFSRLDSREAAHITLRRILQGASFGLVVAAVAGVLLADSLLPLLFGDGWGPVIPLFKLMSGVVVGMSLFYSIKAFFMAQARLAPFIISGRFVQTVCLASAIGIAFVSTAPPLETLALGLSAGLVAGTGAAYWATLAYP